MADNSLAHSVEQWSREVRKGSARLGLLVLLSGGENYGYEIVRGLKEQRLLRQGATEATIYPLLHDLDEGGFVKAQWRPTNNGVPARKYYKLTVDGRKLLSALIKEWAQIRAEMDKLVKEM